MRHAEVSYFGADGSPLNPLDVPLTEDVDESGTFLDSLGDSEPGYANVDDGLVIDDLTRILDARARAVLRLRFREELLQSEIAERVGCSQMHVSRIIRSSLEKLYAYGSGMQVSK